MPNSPVVIYRGVLSKTIFNKKKNINFISQINKKNIVKNYLIIQ